MLNTNSLQAKSNALAGLIDHTALKPGLMLSSIDQLCLEAKNYGFAAVCVPPMMVKHAKAQCMGSNVLIATVIGFPFGYCAVEAKIAEILLAMVDGADELDVVVNYTAIKNKDWLLVSNEINHLMPIIKGQNKCIKVIIESGVLTFDEMEKCCDLYAAAGVDFVKTSTGYAEQGATIEAVAFLRSKLPPNIQIKASGGIKTYGFAQALVEAGATRLGCSSSIAILEGQTVSSNY